MQELATRQQIKLIAEGLCLSSSISINLLKNGKWQPTNLELLKEYLNSLESAIKTMTELVMEQAVLAEAEKLMKEIGGNKSEM